MKALLDAHAALWWLADDPRLGADAVRVLTDRSSQIILSAVIVWEVAIKASLGKLQAPADLAETLLAAGALPLGISIQHAQAIRDLAWRHRDPFDRLLVAQAQVEDAAVITADDAFTAYGVEVIW